MKRNSRLTEQTETAFTFVWSPEGRPLTTITASTLKQAKQEFKKQFPAHAKYMGEVYVTFTPRSYYAVYESRDASRTMLGGVYQSKSSRFSHKQDAVDRLAAVQDIHNTLNPPLNVAGEVRESWEPAEIVRHCQTTQAVGCICPECGQEVK